MAVAIFSDIHANLVALEQALRFARERGVGTLISLGDIVDYGPWPNECVEIVRQQFAVSLMGNHDHAVVGGTDIRYFNVYAQQSVLWTRQHLLQTHLDYLSRLPFTHEENDLLYVHSTPLHPEEWDYILSESDARYYFKYTAYRLIFIGHSHYPVIFSEKEGMLSPRRLKLDLENDRYIINVGSVGQPRDGDPRLCFVIYDPDAREIEYVRLEYDIDKTAKAIRQAGLPEYLANRLYQGM